MSGFSSPQVPDDIHQRGVGQVSYAADNRMVVWFFKKSEQNNFLSQQEGRPIFEGKDFVHIQQPGERDSVEREARWDDKQRWERKWDAYQAGLEQQQSGTPTATLFPVNPETVDMLRALKVTTAEQLADMTEQGISRLGLGGRQLVQKAKDFLEASKGMASAHALQKQIDDKDDQIRQLLQRVDALERTAKTQESPEKRGPGRPPKREYGGITSAGSFDSIDDVLGQ